MLPNLAWLTHPVVALVVLLVPRVMFIVEPSGLVSTDEILLWLDETPPILNEALVVLVVRLEPLGS